MAVNNGIIYEVRNGGSDTNGGGFRGGANLAAPSAPSVSNSGSGGSVAANTYKIVITLNDGNGESEKSAEASTTTSGSSSTITVTDPTTAAGQTFAVYVGTAAGGPYFQQSTGNARGANKVITTTPPTSGAQAPGTDYTKQTAAQVTVNNSTITATTAGANSNVITFTGYTPTAADVGNLFYPTAGTNVNLNIPYEIVGWTSTTWTVQGNSNFTTGTGAASAIVGKMGGAFASPGWAMNIVNQSGNQNGAGVYLKYNVSPYSITSNTINVAGGKVLTKGHWLVGYDTTRARLNTDANRPTLQVNVAGGNEIVQGDTTDVTIRNLIADANGNNPTAFTTGGNIGTLYERCKATGVFGTGFAFEYQTSIICDCEANGCVKGYNVNGGLVVRCTAISCTSIGFSTNNQGQAFEDCVAKSCAIGFQPNVTACMIRNCSAYNSTTIGFDMTNAPCWLENCIAYGSGTYNYKTAGSAQVRMNNCAGGGAGTANYDATIPPVQIIGFVALSADPFTNGSGGDFSLNNTAGGGVACKGAGLPGSTSTTALAGLSTNAYPDLGAAQSQTSAAGAASTIIW